MTAPDFKVIKGGLKHDIDLQIATGKQVNAVKWHNSTKSWSWLVGRLSDSIRTHETHAEFMKMSKTEQGKIKDVGGFVGGSLKDGRRLAQNVISRQVITLDADFLQEGQSLVDLMLDKDELNVAFVVYSTHKNSPKAPRQRLVVPLSRTVSPDEYEAIARKIAEKLDIEVFDDSTYQTHRLMFWPSHSSDSEPFFYFYDEDILDPDVILNEYPDWTDASFWPYSSRVSEIVKKDIKKAGDPLEKAGMIGAFCQAYTVPEAIAEFLPDIYEKCADEKRYTYTNGSTAAGLVIYNDGLFAYSNHSTDPAGNQLCNAFDLVRIHKFGHLDDDTTADTPISKRPSYKAMVEFCQKEPGTLRKLADIRQSNAVSDFAGDLDQVEEQGKDAKNWKEMLETKKDGSIAPTGKNALIILYYDEHLKSIRYNTMSETIEASVKDLPWKRDTIHWFNLDTDQLYMWITNTHGVQFPKELFCMALNTVANKRRYHPVEQYLEGCPEWDGVERVPRLLIDYLGAEDTVFNREAITKTLIAAVARIYQPGIKFDYMLILNGPQGIGKSTFFQRLFMDFISENLTMMDMRDKTGSEKVQGYWALEVAEMTGMRKADIESVKAFISRQEDIYRPAYGRMVERHKRRCVIVGSTNAKAGFLRDITGNRRFWPVVCAGGTDLRPWHIDADTLAQIWAEALHRFRSGESLLLSESAEKIAKKKQIEAMEDDPRRPEVEKFLAKKILPNWDSISLDARRDFWDDEHSQERDDLIERKTVCNMEIWVECLHKRSADMERKDADALTALMMKMDGWERPEKKKRMKIYGLQRVYERQLEEEDLGDF